MTELYLLITVLLVPIILILVNVVAARYVTAELLVPAGIQKNCGAECLVRVKNASVLPLSRVKCSISATNHLTREHRNVIFSFSSMPKSEKGLNFELNCHHCGRMTISIEELRIFDCFGLVPIKRKIASSADVTILPNTFSTEIHIAQNASTPLDAENYSAEKAGQDYSETFQIREYAVGDSPKQIHWKLTQKYDKLIVRDPALPIAKTVLIFWDKTTPEKALSPDEADAMAEVAVSLCQSLAENTTAYRVAWNEPETSLCTAYDVADFEALCEAISKMLSVPHSERGISGINSYVQLNGVPKYSHIIYLSASLPGDMSALAAWGNVTALVCAEYAKIRIGGRISVIPFNTADYAKTLFDLNIG